LGNISTGENNINGLLLNVITVLILSFCLFCYLQKKIIQKVSVTSGLDKQLDKLRRKEEKKQAKRVANGDGDAELDWLAGLGGFYALVEASEKGSGVIDNMVGKGDDTLLTGTTLPQGSIRKVFKGYEEVRVPATPTAALKPNEKLVRSNS
jgi:activating signal cointegrator complex subunit 3